MCGMRDRRAHTAHVNPLMRVRTAPPTLSIASLRAINTPHQNTAAPKTQTTSPLAAHFQRFSRRRAIPPRTAAASPPNGGNCVIRATTRRRHADSQLLMLQNPHHSQPEEHRAASKTWTQHRFARQNSPSTTPLVVLPRQSSPSTQKNTEFGVF